MLEVLKGDIPQGMRFTLERGFVEQSSHKPTEEELKGQVSHEVSIDMYIIEQYRIEEGELTISALDNIIHVPPHIEEVLRKYFLDQKK